MVTKVVGKFFDYLTKEDAQAVTEYVIFMAILAVILVNIGKSVREKFVALVQRILESNKREGLLAASGNNREALYKFKLLR